MEPVLCQCMDWAGHCPLPRCTCPDVPSGVEIPEGLTFVDPQAPAAFEAEQGLGLSCVAHASGSSANMLYTTTKIWGPNFSLLPFLVAHVAMGAF